MKTAVLYITYMIITQRLFRRKFGLMGRETVENLVIMDFTSTSTQIINRLLSWVNNFRSTYCSSVADIKAPGTKMYDKKC